MLEANGNLFELAKGGVLCITTNGFVKKNGDAVMGRGCAKQASQRWPDFPKILGSSIKENGNIPSVRFGVSGYQAVVAFPVKHNWWERADLELIAESAERLRNTAEALGWSRVFVPRPGCGNGGLRWEDVKPVLEPYFDDRFVIVDF